MPGFEVCTSFWKKITSFEKGFDFLELFFKISATHRMLEEDYFLEIKTFFETRNTFFELMYKL